VHQVEVVAVHHTIARQSIDAVAHEKRSEAYLGHKTWPRPREVFWASESPARIPMSRMMGCDASGNSEESFKDSLIPLRCRNHLVMKFRKLRAPRNGNMLRPILASDVRPKKGKMVWDLNVAFSQVYLLDFDLAQLQPNRVLFRSFSTNH